MAEFVAFRNNALPYPIYGAPFVIVYPFLDADGDLVTGAAAPDAEISKNGDTFVDCTSESVEIATASGVYYLSLTATELTCDAAAIIAKSSTSGLKTTVSVLYPRKFPTVWSGTSTSLGSLTTNILLDAGASTADDYYNGMLCIATTGTNVEVRIIADYVGSTKSALVTPGWNTAPTNSTTFVIKLTEGIGSAPLTTLAPSFASAVWDLDATGHQTQGTFGQVLGDSASTATSVWTAATNIQTRVPTALVGGRIDASVGAMANDVITAASVAADADGAAQLTDIQARLPAALISGRIDASVGALGANSVNASALATDAVTEIADGVWDELTSGHTISGSTGLALTSGASAATVAAAVWDLDATAHQTQGTFGQAIGDPTTNPATLYGTSTQLQVDTDDIQTRLPAALVSGRIDASVGAMAANVLTSTAINADAITATKVASDVGPEIATSVWDMDATAHQTQGTFGQAIGDPAATAKSIWGVANALPNSGALTTLQADTDDIQARLPAALVSGRIDASVGAAAASVITATSIATGAITNTKFASAAIDATAIATDAIGASEISAAAVTKISDGVWAKAGADPTGVPATTASLASKLDWITSWFRNKKTMNRITGVTNLRDDADANTISTFTAVDDGTTFTKPKST